MEPDQLLKAGPKVFCKGSSDSRDPVGAHFLNGRSLHRWLHSCAGQWVLYLCRLGSWSWALLQGALGLCQHSGRVQVGICSVSVPRLATRNAANCTKLSSVICGSGNCMPRSFPYFLFLHLFILYFFWKRFVTDHYGWEPKIYERPQWFCVHQVFFLYSCLFLNKRKVTVCKAETKFLSRIEMWQYKVVYPAISDRKHTWMMGSACDPARKRQLREGWVW